MPEKCKIKNYEYDASVFYKDLSGVYKIKSGGKVAKFLINTLRKLGLICQYQEKIASHEIKSVTVNTDKIIDEICKRIDVGPYVMGGEIAGIMVGREQFELIRTDYAMRSSTVVGRMMYSESGDYRIMGVPITLNPFIDGVVFVTKDMIKDMAWK